MKGIPLKISELAEKGRTARTDVANVDALRKIAVPDNGSSFRVEKTLYVFVSDDLTDDDAISSIRSESIPASKPGRFRRAALEIRQKLKTFGG
jgi:transcriptional regulator of met regulon